MAELNTRRVLITEADLSATAAAIEARFSDPDLEADRTYVIRELLAAGMALNQAVRVQLRCAVVNHCGTHGTTNLQQATDTLFEAMFRYAASVRETAARLGEDSTLPEPGVHVLGVA